jgi:hypothetical protein
MPDGIFGSPMLAVTLSRTSSVEPENPRGGTADERRFTLIINAFGR